MKNAMMKVKMMKMTTIHRRRFRHCRRNGHSWGRKIENMFGNSSSMYILHEFGSKKTSALFNIQQLIIFSWFAGTKNDKPGWNKPKKTPAQIPNQAPGQVASSVKASSPARPQEKSKASSVKASNPARPQEQSKASHVPSPSSTVQTPLHPR